MPALPYGPTSRVPIGSGLSSSAALEVATLRALRAARGLALDRRDLDPHHIPGGRLATLDREPGGAPLAQPLELLGHAGIVHLRHRPGKREPAGLLEGDLGPDLDEELELEGAPLLELEVPDAGVGDRLQVLGGPGGIPALPDDLLQRGLLDGLVEPLPDDGLGGLPRAEPGQPRAAGVERHGLVLGGLDPVHRHRDVQGPGSRVGGGGFDGDGCHATNLIRDGLVVGLWVVG